MDAEMNVWIQNTIDLAEDDVSPNYKSRTVCSLWAGGSLLYRYFDSEYVLQEWKGLCAINPFIRRFLTDEQIRAAIAANPNNGQLLIGVFDDLGWDYDSHIRRQPRGYMLFWRKENLNE